MQTEIVRDFKNKTGYTLEVKNGKLHYDGDLDLRDTGITSLPDNLTVGGDLYLEGTGITDRSKVNRNLFKDCFL